MVSRSVYIQEMALFPRIVMPNPPRSPAERSSIVSVAALSSGDAVRYAALQRQVCTPISPHLATEHKSFGSFGTTSWVCNSQKVGRPGTPTGRWNLLRTNLLLLTVICPSPAVCPTSRLLPILTTSMNSTAVIIQEPKKRLPQVKARDVRQYSHCFALALTHSASDRVHNGFF